MATRRSERVGCEDVGEDVDHDADPGSCNDTALRRSHFCPGEETKNVATGDVAPRSASGSSDRAVRVGYKMPRGVSSARQEDIARTPKWPRRCLTKIAPVTVVGLL